MPNLYTRWTKTSDRRVKADILLPGVEITYDTGSGEVHAKIDPMAMDPDTARMIGVRLVEAASRAEGDRKTRH